MRYTPWILGGIALTVPALYVLAYLILLDPYVYNAIGGVARAPAYRWINSTETERFFKPLSDLDHQIRPAFWYKPGPYDPNL